MLFTNDQTLVYSEIIAVLKEKLLLLTVDKQNFVCEVTTKLFLEILVASYWFR